MIPPRNTHPETSRFLDQTGHVELNVFVCVESALSEADAKNAIRRVYDAMTFLNIETTAPKLETFHFPDQKTPFRAWVIRGDRDNIIAYIRLPQ